MGWNVRTVQVLEYVPEPVRGVGGGSMNTNHVLLLVTCVLILCVLSFSVPPPVHHTEYLVTNHKTQHIRIGDGKQTTKET
jgi:hypothetical protein